MMANPAWNGVPLPRYIVGQHNPGGWNVETKVLAAFWEESEAVSFIDNQRDQEAVAAGVFFIDDMEGE